MRRFHHFLHIGLSFLFILLIAVGIFSREPIVFADTTSTLRPIADGGEDSADWDNTGGTACNATDCYIEVDESSGGSCTNSDGDTSYVRSDSISVSQTFDIDESGIPDNATITQIDITVCDMREQGGARLQTRRCVDGSCTDFGSTIVPSASYEEHTQSHTGLSIVKSAGTDIEIGLTNIAAKGIRVSQISAVITYTPPADTTAPDAVSDLAASSATQTTIDLDWTAPGDDGSSGTATSYDIRYSTATITEGNWSSATQASGEPTPSVAGTNELMTVSGLTAETTYYFAVKTSDEVPNESAISNVPSLATSAAPDTTAPDVVSDLALSGATDTTINLDWTAPGDDGSTGTASSYDIRYSTAEITAGNFDSATAVSGEPTPSVAGTNELMTVSGLIAETTYYFAVKTSDEVPNESAISNVPTLATSAAAAETSTTVSTGGGVAASKVLFSGQAYPGSSIEVLQKDSVGDIYLNIPITSYSVLADGTFSVSYTALIGGNYFFAVRAEDKDGRKTGILSFTVNLVSNDLEVTDIFVPPTVGLINTVVTKNDNLEVVGYAAPNAKIEFEIDDILQGETTSDSLGYYTFSVSTAKLTLNEHYIRARQINDGGNESNLSFPRAFKVSLLTNPLADFNKDNTVNITDWSIFLFRWGSEDTELQEKIDMDDSGTVDIFDFSIFLEAMNT